MKNPFDESGLTTINGIPPEIVKDSLALFTYPNPFNSQTNILVKTKSPSIVTISIYNILGQLVATIAENETIQDIKTYSWHGTNNSTNHSAAVHISYRLSPGIWEAVRYRLG